MLIVHDLAFGWVVLPENKKRQLDAGSIRIKRDVAYRVLYDRSTDLSRRKFQKIREGGTTVDFGIGLVEV